MSKILNKVMLSMSTLVLAGSLIVGGSYALFSDSATVNNHLEAGGLKIGLNRVAFQEKALQGDGTLKESVVDETRIDLRTDGTKLFEFVKAVPTSWQKAKIEVTNLGNVAFDYGVKMLFNTDGNADVSTIALASQIQITISNDDTLNESFYLANASENDVKIGSILANGAAQTFEVKAEFVNLEDNNDAQLATLDFDMQVYATQKVA